MLKIRRTTITLLILTVLASGCTSITEQIGGGDDPKGGDLKSTPAQGKGLEVQKFTITDSHLTPNQRSVVSLSLKNYHTIPIEIDDFYLYNLGELQIIDGKSCDNEIPASENGLNPVLECSWTISAPGADALGNFKSKTYNPRLMIRYDSRLTNSKQALPVVFKPGTDIESTGPVSKTFSNGELEATLTTDSPVPNEGSSNLDIEVSPIAESHLISDTYTFEIRPSAIIGTSTTSAGEECIGTENTGSEEDGKYVIEVRANADKSASISCQISSEARRQVQRNVILSTLYKYQQSPALNIEVKSTND